MLRRRTRLRLAGVLAAVAVSAAALGANAVPPHDALGRAGGALPAGTTAFAAGVPGVAHLDPSLRAALRRATVDASADGVRLVVDSGWRSAAYQQHLLDAAIAQYGSRQAAEHWVATPGTSAHVSGDAVDVGPPAGAAWLGQRGAAYGLCRVYADEPWHYELRPAAGTRGCPPTYADPTQDPRMRISARS